MPLRLRAGEHELAFFSTVATFGTAIDITVAELSIESFFPADAQTAEVVRAYVRGLPGRALPPAAGPRADAAGADTRREARISATQPAPPAARAGPCP